ncbi:MAG: hypothetical protein CM15mP47_1220 [Methanobacteriota archaeon]|nr:MAG: hypothetical protein CM15mP47_1220 [Euryarchaeota archaeon]
MAQTNANPWPMRVAILGIVCLLVGAVAIFSNMDQIDEASSPKKINEAAITGGGIETIEFKQSCYSAVVISDDISNVSLLKMSGSDIAGDAIDSGSCKTDWTPMDSDGSKFTIIKEWDVPVKGEYVLEVECESNCDNSTLWLVDATSAQWRMLEQPALVFGGAACCIGLVILPLAFILYLTNKNSGGPKVMMVGANGQVMPITDLTPENIAKLQSQQAEKVDNPFADTGITDSAEFVDGREDVQKGTLLTTEQVFALMKGDVDEAQSRVADPFADYNTIRQTESEKVVSNTREIASWDEVKALLQTNLNKRRKLEAVRSPITHPNNLNPNPVHGKIGMKIEVML